MSLAIFPASPLPADLGREKAWGENQIIYDSGAMQSDTAYVRPLYRWNVPFKNYTEVKHSSLWLFWDQVKGRTFPFLMKDPYDYFVDSVMAVRSGITNAATLNLYDLNSYMVRPDTLFIGSLFSTLSGYVRNGVEYSLDQDTGILTVNTKAVTDVWGARSMFYFKKCTFRAPFVEKSPLWNVFGTELTIWELP
jgi:hypothetical protein